MNATGGARVLLRTTLAAIVVAASTLLIATTPSPTPSPTPTPTTDPVQTAEYWLDGAKIRDAWAVTRGAGVTIAVIDTGVARGPAFDVAVKGGTDVSDLGSPDGRTPVGPLDSDHGSFVASLAAARPKADGSGMIGVAPEADLLSISLGFGSSAPVPFAKQVADAMVWAVDHGADVINLSFTTNTLDWDPSWDEAFLYAYEHDVVVVVAAGNRGSGTTQVGAPATIPGVLTVGGVDQHGMASRSASTQGITIGVSAPSEGLLGIAADGEVKSWNGTSGAAPIVAGIAALVRAAHPDLDAGDVINRITRTARPAPAATQRPDPLYGYGLVDAEAAVNAAVDPVDTSPKDELTEWIRLHRRGEAPEVPQPTSAPVSIPPLEAAEPPTVSGSPLIPSADSLLYGTLPLIAVTLPGILIGLGVTAAARRIRSARARRTPSP
ncbi:S8 family serine peptidase [Microbacterium resistens]|uniref:S8 family serine peptidase n=1 Tax=Microbacterium resistens TaxID=156977 RepID=A0ABY3RVA3_9MICO|nr:S8 family serine peptidase [Microbacterium resistens]UGS26824.1 S8 family serine peptidase [Microbacterium resistens]